METILRGENVMWPVFKKDRIQVDKHAGEQNAKWTWSQIEEVLYENNPKYGEQNVSRIQSSQNQ